MKEGVLDQALEKLKVAGDSVSFGLLSNANLKQKVEIDLQKQSEKFGSKLSVDNYEAVLNQAPFNPYLVERISDYLALKGKKLEAYNVAFYATEVNSNSAIIWKTLAKRALDISEFEYAQDALKELETLLPPGELQTLKNLYQERKEKVQSGGF
jgi:predicted Zn-dependent protease